MKSKLIKNGGGNSLLIFYLGWSCDPKSLEEFRPKGWDILMIYDYFDLEFPVEAVAALTEYERFALIAHSFGVAVAHTHITKFPELVTSIAICGTLAPVNDKFGIPCRLFDLTLRSIGREGIAKFNAKMCGDRLSQYKPSTLEFNSQVTALKLLGDSFRDATFTEEDKNRWKIAVICMKDEIIPVDNQVAFWGDSQAEVMGFKTQPHYPFNNVFSQFISTIL